MGTKNYMHCGYSRIRTIVTNLISDKSPADDDRRYDGGSSRRDEASGYNSRDGSNRRGGRGNARPTRDTYVAPRGRSRGGGYSNSRHRYTGFSHWSCLF